MTTKITVKVNQELVRTFTYTAAVPIPELGETVVHPKSDGSIIQVQKRTFEYGEDRLKVILDCA